MDSAIRPHHAAYDLLVNHTGRGQRRGARQVTGMSQKLFEPGKRTTHRLTVCGLTYLRELRRLQ